MNNKFLAATILSLGLSAGFADVAKAGSADVQVNLGTLQKLNSGYQAPVSSPALPVDDYNQRRKPVHQPSAIPQFIEPQIDQRTLTQAPLPKPKPKYTPRKAPATPTPQVAAAPAAEAPLNAPLPANYDPAMFAPKGPSLKVTATGNQELPPRHVAESPALPPEPEVTEVPPPIAPAPQKIAEVPPANEQLVAPPAPLPVPAPLKPADMPRRTPELQGTKPASDVPAPLPVPPTLPKLAELPKTDTKPIEPKKIASEALTPPAPPPLVITPEDNVVKSTDSKPLLSPKDALEIPKIAIAPAAKEAPAALITPPALPPALPPAPPMGKMAMPPTPPAPPAPPVPELNKKIEAQVAKLNEQPKVAELKDEKSPLAALPPIPVPPAPPTVKDLPPLPTTKKADANLEVPPPPSALPSLSKLFEKKDDVPALPPAQTVAKPDAVKVQTAGLPDAPPPTAPAATGSDSVSIPYAEAEVEIPPSEQAKLQALADMLAADKKAKVNIAAYASGTEDQVALALRTSFGRAVKIRKFFIDRNISEDRINVKALGNKSDSGVPDRVDVSVTKSS